MAEKKQIVQGLQFVADDITGEQVEDFIAAFNANKIREQSAIMAALCVQCPKEWGDAKKSETFSKLKFVLFKQARDHFMEDVADLGKNLNGVS